MNEAENDIGTALMRLNAAFEKHRMSVLVVELSTWEDGMRLRTTLGPEYAYQVVFDDETGQPKNQVELAGMFIRWPVKRRAIETETNFKRQKGFRYE